MTHHGSDVTVKTARLDLKHMCHIWLLKSPVGQNAIAESVKGGLHAFLISTSGCITISKMIPQGFDTTASTICCVELDATTVQVTPRGVFQVCTSSHSPTFDYYMNKRVWKANYGRIIGATGNGGSLLIALSNRTLVCKSTSAPINAARVGFA